MRPERGKRGASELLGGTEDLGALWAGRTLMGAEGCATGRIGGQGRPLPQSSNEVRRKRPPCCQAISRSPCRQRWPPWWRCGWPSGFPDSRHIPRRPPCGWHRNHGTPAWRRCAGGFRGGCGQPANPGRDRHRRHRRPCGRLRSCHRRSRRWPGWRWHRRCTGRRRTGYRQRRPGCERSSGLK